MWHLDRLTEEDRLDALVDMLELGLDVVMLTEGLLRSAVLQGIHSVDISLIIAPVIHEFIVTTAEKTGIEFEEGFPDNSKEKFELKYAVNNRKSMKMLEEMGLVPDVEDEEAPTPSEGMGMTDDPVEEEMKAPAGLMARKGDMV